MKTCPICQRHFADAKRFCDECAEHDGGPVRLQPARPTDIPSGIEIGDKAVVSGEVIANKQENVYQGTANITNITQLDDTKRVLDCAMCGLKGTVANGFHRCPSCKRDACIQHFDRDARLCHGCRDSETAGREDRYRQMTQQFTAHGGIIDPYERVQLDQARGTLGLTAERAATLEQTSTIPETLWGPDQQRILDASRRLLIEEGDADEAVARLDHLAKLFPARDEVQSLWLEALAERDPTKALNATERIGAELPSLYVVRARLLAEQGRYQEGLDLLDDALAKPSMEAARPQLMAGEAEVFLHHFRATGKRYFLGDAAIRLEGFAGSQDSYVQAVAAWLAYERGDRNALASGASPGLHLRRIRRSSEERLKIDELIGGLQRIYVEQDPLSAAHFLDVEDTSDHLVHACVLAWIRRNIVSDLSRFNVWKEAARANHPPALWLMGACSLCGIDTITDAVAALGWFRRSMEHGFPLAKAILGECLVNQVGGEHDAAETSRLLSEAAEEVGGWAVIEWAGSLDCAQDQIEHPGRALALLKPLCERGWPTAEFLLGKCLARSADACSAQAQDLVQRAAEHGHPRAQSSVQRPTQPSAEAKPWTGRMIRSRAQWRKVWE